MIDEIIEYINYKYYMIKYKIIDWNKYRSKIKVVSYGVIGEEKYKIE